MTKAQLITKIARDLGVFKPMANKALEAVISNITNALAEEEAVVLRGFGTFNVILKDMTGITSGCERDNTIVR